MLECRYTSTGTCRYTCCAAPRTSPLEERDEGKSEGEGDGRAGNGKEDRGRIDDKENREGGGGVPMFQSRRLFITSRSHLVLVIPARTGNLKFVYV